MSRQKPLGNSPGHLPSTPRGEARREAIIETGVRMFARRGWRATGLIGLAKEVGITHGGVLHHFGTKENLLRAVAARRDEYQAKLIGIMGNNTRLDAIRVVLPATAEDHLSNPQLAQLFSVLVAESFEADEPLHDYFKGRHQMIRNYYAQALRQGQKRGEIRKDIDPDLAAASISAFISGMQTLWLLDPDDVDLAAVYKQHVEMLLRALT